MIDEHRTLAALQDRTACLIANHGAVAIGASNANSAGGMLTGAAHVFTRAGAVWTHQQTLVGSDTISMGATISVGLAVSSHRDGTLATATFTNVAIAGS